MAKLVKYKIRKSTKWSSINLTVLEDPNLTPKAKWIHTYLMTRPPDWEIRTKDIINKSTAGRDSIYNGLKELVDKKYIHRKRVYENGRITHWTYDVYEEPTEEPLPENLLPAKPEQENLLPAFQDVEKPDNYYITTVNRQQKKNASHSVGNTLRSPKKKLLTLKIYPREKNPSASEGKFFDSNFASGGNPLSDYYIEKGFGRSDYSPLVLDKYTKLKKKGIPVDTKSLVSLINRWNGYLDENGDKIKLRKGIVLNKHTFDSNLTLLHLQSTITYMTKIKGFSTEEMIKGIENFLGLYLNGHSYNTKANLVEALTSREETFLKCINGSIKKMPNFFPMAKGKKDLKYFVKKGLRELGRDASEDCERFARGFGARGEYQRYLEKTDLTMEEIEEKIAEEVKLLKGK